MADPKLFEDAPPVKRQFSRRDWLSVDWTKPTMDLVGLLGKTDSQITKMRKRLGFPNPPRPNRAELDVDEIERSWLAGNSITHLCKQFAAGKDAIMLRLHERGHDTTARLKKNTYAARFQSGQSIAQIAEEFGVGECAVTDGLRFANVDFRKRFGIKVHMGDTDLAYLAGIIDGEGCIQIIRRKARDGRTQRFDPCITVCNTDKRMLDWLHDTTAVGRVYFEKRKNPKWNDVWRWQIGGRSASDLLRMMLPYLVIKREQAAVVLEFQDLLTSRRGPSKGSNTEIYQPFQDRIKALRTRPNKWNGKLSA